MRSGFVPPGVGRPPGKSGAAPTIHRLEYAKPRETPLRRWLRHRREFLLEEIVAYKRAVLALPLLLPILIWLAFRSGLLIRLWVYYFRR